MRQWARAAIAVVGAVAAVVVPMSSANAEARADGTAAAGVDMAGITFVPAATSAAAESWGTVKHGATGKCLTNTDHSHIYLSTCDANRNDQKWTWTGWYQSSHYRYLKSMHTTWCLDGTQNGGRIYAEPCNQGAYQAWKYDDIYTRNIIQYQSGQVLDGNGSSVYLSPRDSGTNHYQKWY